MTERQSFFSSDLGVSGVYDDADGVIVNPNQENYENKEHETIPEEKPMDLTESGAYTSGKESPYQVGRDLDGTLPSPKAETEHVVESRRNSGLYSRNIESTSIRTGKEEIDKSITGENFYPFKTSWLPEDRGSGIYDTRIDSLNESNRPDSRRSTNSKDDNLKMSRKSRSFNRLGATTLSTMGEEDEQILHDRDTPDLGFSPTDGFPQKRGDNDKLSNSSREKNGEPPNWTDMIFNPGFNEAYLKKAWPRISLHLQHTHRPSDPFAAVTGENLNTEQQRNYGRFIACFLWFGFVILAIIATILLVFLVRTKEDEPKALKEYVKVDMNMTVDDEYLAAYDTPTSSEYKSFTEEFCTEVGKAYQSNNSTQSSYFGCQITDLSPGSIIVIFTVYYRDTSVIIVNENARSVIVSYIESNSNKLGRLVIIVNTIDIKNATIITPEKIPVVQGRPFQTTSRVAELTTVPGTSADSRPTTTVNDITTNHIQTTKMTVATTNIAEKSSSDSGSTIFVSKSTTIVTATKLQGTESTAFVNQPSTSTEYSIITIDTTVIDISLSTDGTKHMTSTSVPDPTIPNEQTTTDTEPTATVPDQTVPTVQTTTVTESIATVLDPTVPPVQTTMITDPITLSVSTVPNEQNTTDIEPTTTIPDPTVPTMLATTETAPTTTVPNPTVPTVLTTTDTEPTTTVPGTTLSTMLATTEIEPTTTIPGPTLSTMLATTDKEPTTTIPYPTVPTMLATTEKAPTTTVPNPTVPTVLTTTDTEPTTTVPDPTVPTVLTTTDTEQTTTVPDPTVPTVLTTTDIEPTTTVPYPTVPTVLTTTDSEPTTTAPGPTLSTMLATTDIEPTTTIPDPTVPTMLATTDTAPTTTVPNPTVPTEQIGSSLTVSELTTSVNELTTSAIDSTTSVIESMTSVTISITSATYSITSATYSIISATDPITPVTDSITLTTDFTTSSRAVSTIQ